LPLKVEGLSNSKIAPPVVKIIALVSPKINCSRRPLGNRLNSVETHLRINLDGHSKLFG